MSPLSKLTVVASIVPLCTAPVVHAHAGEPAVVVAPAPAPTVVVAPATSSVATPQTWAEVAASTTVVTVQTTTATTTTTTAAPTVVAAPVATPTVVPPREAVRTLLRYDPYLAPRYRSGRNMIIGGSISLGLGTVTLMSAAAWAGVARLSDVGTYDSTTRYGRDRRFGEEIRVARVVGTAGAIMAATGLILVIVGAVKRRRAIEEARGRVYMQAAPGGLQVRF
ncbi:MAG: hypothetical protein K1X88_11650 [Nannocystaceae bacterium]|nr:hypothetical protein [Nannocystaceae bacterium]